MNSVSLALDLVRFERIDHAPCPHCDEPLVLHQPDADQPDRLLGTCPDCRAWFLIDSEAEVMVRLPDQDALRLA